MSRSGYDDGESNWRTYGLYRQAVARGITGKRGQRLLRDLVVALDAMPEGERKLITHDLVNADGCVCALGAVAVDRRISPDILAAVDGYDGDPEIPARLLDVSTALASEVMFMNDDANSQVETPEERWARMRKWAVSHIAEPAGGAL